MAQTVAMQRGSVSSTATGSWINLFTQSSGIATRVIPINFEQWFSQSPSGATGYFQLAIVSSAGGGQIISSMAGNTSSLQSFQVTCTNTNGADIVGISTTAASKSIGWKTGTTASPYNAGIASASATYGTTAGGNPNAINQFFMGNGDSLRYRITGIYNAGKTYASCTTNANFSFVTVTES